MGVCVFIRSQKWIVYRPSERFRKELNMIFSMSPIVERPHTRSTMQLTLVNWIESPNTIQPEHNKSLSNIRFWIFNRVTFSDASDADGVHKAISMNIGHNISFILFSFFCVSSRIRMLNYVFCSRATCVWLFVIKRNAHITIIIIAIVESFRALTAPQHTSYVFINVFRY